MASASLFRSAPASFLILAGTPIAGLRTAADAQVGPARYLLSSGRKRRKAVHGPFLARCRRPREAVEALTKFRQARQDQSRVATTSSGIASGPTQAHPKAGRVSVLANHLFGMPERDGMECRAGNSKRIAFTQLDHARSLAFVPRDDGGVTRSALLLTQL
jgi:hypothetical protein